MDSLIRRSPISRSLPLCTAIRPRSPAWGRYPSWWLWCKLGNTKNMHNSLITSTEGKFCTQVIQFHFCHREMTEIKVISDKTSTLSCLFLFILNTNAFLLWHVQLESKEKFCWWMLIQHFSPSFILKAIVYSLTTFSGRCIVQKTNTIVGPGQ